MADTIIRDRRRLTPRIEGFVFARGTELDITFDRVMDENHIAAVVRLFDPDLGILDFTDFTWSDSRSLSSSSSTPVLDSYAGPQRIVYLSGDIRAYERYFLSIGEECGQVVFNIPRDRIDGSGVHEVTIDGSGEHADILDGTP